MWLEGRAERQMVGSGKASRNLKEALRVKEGGDKKL